MRFNLGCDLLFEGCLAFEDCPALCARMRSAVRFKCSKHFEKTQGKQALYRRRPELFDELYNSEALQHRSNRLVRKYRGSVPETTVIQTLRPSFALPAQVMALPILQTKELKGEHSIQEVVIANVDHLRSTA